MFARSLNYNPLLLCAFHGLAMALFPIAIITLLWKDQFGLSMAEIMLLQAVFGVVVAAMEFPSGYVADRLGYRPTLLGAAICSLLGWAVYLVAFDFWTVALAEGILGIAFSFISGADTALLYESLQATGREGDFAFWYGRFRFSGEIAEGSAALAAGLLFAWWDRLPFVLEIFVWAISVGVAWLLVEPARHRPPTTQTWSQVQRLFRFVFHEQRYLRTIIFLMVVLGTASFIPVWLIQLYARDAGVPVAWLGVLWAAANYSVALGSFTSARLGQSIGLLPALLLCILLTAVGYLGLGLSHALFGFAFYFCLTVMRGLNGPLLHVEEQQLIPSSDRAGLISLRSFMFRGNFVWIGPAIGYAVDHIGQYRVLLSIGPILTVTALFGWYWLARARASHQQFSV